VVNEKPFLKLFIIPKIKRNLMIIFVLIYLILALIYLFPSVRRPNDQ